MKNIKILHVASFTGNIGDNANHSGFRSLFNQKFFDYEIIWNDYEIRETYWGNKKFDSEFVELANNHDLLIFGGGNYFELWVEKSNTGCSIDIKKEYLDKINVPILYNSLGVDPAQGVTEESISKFERFLDINIQKGAFISCRNDGSSNAINTYLKEKYNKSIYRTIDAGLFTEISKDTVYPEISKDKKNIIFQLAKDMENIRWPGGKSFITYDDFLNEISKTINILGIDYNIILIPHIYSDITVINDVLLKVDDKIRRSQVSVSPYLTGDVGKNYIFGLYSKADVICGTRFHSNIVAYGLKKQLIALVNYRQIRELVIDLGIESDSIEINRPNFSVKLIESINNKIKSNTSSSNKVDEYLSDYNIYLNEVKIWFERNEYNAD